MVENAEDVLGETKQYFVEISGDVKPPNVEAKSNIDGASVHVEASKYVGGSGVLPLQAHEVDTARFFSDDVKSKDRDKLLEWARRQANKAGFTIDDLKAQLNTYFEYPGENQYTRHLFGQMPCMDLGEDRDEYAWKTASYMP